MDPSQSGLTKSQEISQSPKLRIYIYIDDVLWYKTEIFSQTSNPILDLRLKIDLPLESQEIRFDMYDAANLKDEEINQIQKMYTRVEQTLSPSVTP